MTPADTPDRPEASGIVLAGGRSARFGGDKLAVRLDGLTLLERSARAVAGVCAEVIIVISPSGPEPLLSELTVPVRVVRDHDPFGGPVAGLAAGLRAAGLPVVVVVGGDMPWLEVGRLAGMIGRLVEPGVDLVLLASPDGPMPLPFVAWTTTLNSAVDVVLGGKNHSLRSLHAAVPRVVAIPVGAQEPSLWDVDRPADLARAFRSRAE